MGLLQCHCTLNLFIHGEQNIHIPSIYTFTQKNYIIAVIINFTKVNVTFIKVDSNYKIKLSQGLAYVHSCKITLVLYLCT